MYKVFRLIARARTCMYDQRIKKFLNKLTHNVPLTHLLYEDFCNLYTYILYKVYFRRNKGISDHSK